MRDRLKIPYCFFPEGFVRRGASLFSWLADFMKRSNPQVELDMKRAGMNISTATYISAAAFSDLILFLFLLAFTAVILSKYSLTYMLVAAPAISIIVTGFVFFQQMTYPKSLVIKKVKGIEMHLLSALRAMQIQISSGIPLYNVIVTISRENYGGVSEQFRRVVKEIEAGAHQVNALDHIASENPSTYFQRMIWQLTTAMKSGSDLGSVLEETTKSLSEEQIVQVQEYGSKLSPLTMFYMLVVVIVPALALTFFVVLGSFLSLGESVLKDMFWGMFGAVIFFQLFFLSMISSKRPNLL
ncbi:MAG: type II secretion system F family protein [Candidatus Woesearchaeota archaeon]